MKLRCRFSFRALSFVCAAALSVPPIGGAAITAEAAVPDAASPVVADAVPPFRSPTFEGREESAVVAAYEDVRRILREDNSCSRFFGPPEMSVHVLSQFFANLRSAGINDRSVGIRMSGQYRNITSLAYQFSYRIFDDVVINKHGPFFRTLRPGRREISMVGSFPANSREVRALMLLHELGHLIKGANDRWLLSDDYGDAYVGERNTWLIESKCRRQLKRLRDERPLVS